MKLQIKQLLTLTLLIVVLFITIGVVIPFFAIQLSNYDITDVFLVNESLLIILSILIHFLLCAFIVNKISNLRGLKNRYIFIYFMFFYLGITLIIRTSKNLSLNYFLLEFSLLIGVLIGLIYRKTSKRTIKTSLAILVIFFMYFTFHITIPFANQYNSYANFNGSLDKPFIKDVVATDISNKTKIIYHTKNNKIYVLDFWNNHCASCFQKFPLLIKLQSKYKNNNKIEIYAVNVFSDKNEIDESRKLLQNTGNLNLESLYLEKNQSALFDLKWYPKTIIIKNGKIIFEGNLETLILLEKKYLK